MAGEVDRCLGMRNAQKSFNQVGIVVCYYPAQCTKIEY
jgi:hypothetical protein